MIGIPISELSQAQANVEPHIRAIVNYDPAIAPFQRIFAAASATTLTLNA